MTRAMTVTSMMGPSFTKVHGIERFRKYTKNLRMRVRVTGLGTGWDERVPWPYQQTRQWLNRYQLQVRIEMEHSSTKIVIRIALRWALPYGLRECVWLSYVWCVTEMIHMIADRTPYWFIRVWNTIVDYMCVDSAVVDSTSTWYRELWI